MYVAATVRELPAVISPDGARTDNCDSKSHSLSGWALFGLKVSRDQARALVETEIRPGPLKEHGKTIAKADEKNDVDEQPGEPGRNSAEVNQFQIGDRFITADRGH